MAWEEVWEPKKIDGLGIKRVRDIKKAILTKWLWRFGKEDRNLWRKVIAEIYGLANF